jgi:hypothetical protein
MRELTEQTLIPVSFLTVVIGGVYWLTTLHADVMAQSEKLAVVEQRVVLTDQKYQKSIETVYSIKEDVAVIKAILQNRKSK